TRSGLRPGQIPSGRGRHGSMCHIAPIAIVTMIISATGHAQTLTSPCPAGISAISGCPVTGCGGVADALLNEAKKRTDAPASPTDVTVADIKALLQPTD